MLKRSDGRVVVTAPTHRKVRDVWGTRFWGGVSSEGDRDNVWATRPTIATESYEVKLVGLLKALESPGHSGSIGRDHPTRM